MKYWTLPHLSPQLAILHQMLILSNNRLFSITLWMKLRVCIEGTERLAYEGLEAIIEHWKEQKPADWLFNLQNILVLFNIFWQIHYTYNYYGNALEGEVGFVGGGGGGVRGPFSLLKLLFTVETTLVKVAKFGKEEERVEFSITA